MCPLEFLCHCTATIHSLTLNFRMKTKQRPSAHPKSTTLILAFRLHGVKSTMCQLTRFSQKRSEKSSSGLWTPRETGNFEKWASIISCFTWPDFTEEGKGNISKYIDVCVKLPISCCRGGLCLHPFILRSNEAVNSSEELFPNPSHA